jgi:hypothetical protein
MVRVSVFRTDSAALSPLSKGPQSAAVMPLGLADFHVTSILKKCTNLTAVTLIA